LLGRIADIPRMTSAARQFQELLPALPECTPAPVRSRDTEWFLRMLDAPLSAEELARLGSSGRAPSRQVAANQ